MKTLSELVDKSVKKTAFFVIVLSSNMKKSFQSIYVGHTLTAINVKIFPHFVWIWLMGLLHFPRFQLWYVSAFIRNSSAKYVSPVHLLLKVQQLCPLKLEN
jgi:hypothetical protein